MKTGKSKAKNRIYLRSRQFRKILKEYIYWLEALGYSQTVTQGYPRLLQTFFIYLEEKGISTTGRITKNDITEYHQHLKRRENQRQKGKLGNYYINTNLLAIKKLSEYLYRAEGKILPVEHIQLEKIKRESRTYLTKAEVEALFKASHESSRYGYRDRAILALYYGCGLRRNEGINLHVKDIDFLRGLIYVREGKGGKERFVPMSKTVAKYLRDYISKGRPLFSKGKYAKSLFLNYRGEKIDSQSLYLRLKYLQQKSNCDTLKRKQIGLHTLRHSIATHLLQNNVELETIAQFLGHSTLESTQIYTHIEENEFTPV